MIVQSTFIWANYLLSNSPYCMIYLRWETERENWSWSLLGVKGLIVTIMQWTVNWGFLGWTKHFNFDPHCSISMQVLEPMVGFSVISCVLAGSSTSHYICRNLALKVVHTCNQSWGYQASMSDKCVWMPKEIPVGKMTYFQGMFGTWLLF